MFSIQDNVAAVRVVSRRFSSLLVTFRHMFGNSFSGPVQVTSCGSDAVEYFDVATSSALDVPTHELRIGRVNTVQVYVCAFGHIVPG